MNNSAKSKNSINYSVLFMFISLLLAAEPILLSQVSSQWVSRYNRNNNGNDFPRSMAVDPQGNIYITGISHNPAGVYDATLLKYSPSGSLLWTQHYIGSGGGTDEFNSIDLDNAGNIFVTGSTYSDSVLKYDCITAKYNNNGVLQWAVKYNRNNFDDIGYFVKTDINGNVFVTGRSDSTGNTKGFLTIKYNSSGELQWTVRKFGNGAAYNYPSSLAVDNNSNVYIAGTHFVTNNNYDIIIIKYNTNGNEQWVARYINPGNTFDIASKMVSDNQGNLYITGNIFEGSNKNCIAIKYDTTGTQKWADSYNGTGSNYDAGLSIAVNNSGEVFVTGVTQMSSENFDFLTIKYNSAGTRQWASNYNGISNRYDYGADVITDNLGNVYVTGPEAIDTLGNKDYTTIKYGPAGNTLWVRSYNGETGGSDMSNFIKLDAGNSVIVTGNSPGNGQDIVTIKYSQNVGISQISNEIPRKFSLSQNFPNPFNPSTTINFSITEKTLVRLEVFNILGELAAQPVNSLLNAGFYSAAFDASGMASGVYFYTLTDGSKKLTKKMILIK